MVPQDKMPLASLTLPCTGSLAPLQHLLDSECTQRQPRRLSSQVFRQCQTLNEDERDGKVPNAVDAYIQIRPMEKSTATAAQDKGSSAIIVNALHGLHGEGCHGRRRQLRGPARVHKGASDQSLPQFPSSLSTAPSPLSQRQHVQAQHPHLHCPRGHCHFPSCWRTCQPPPSSISSAPSPSSSSQPNDVARHDRLHHRDCLWCDDSHRGAARHAQRHRRRASP